MASKTTLLRDLAPSRNSADDRDPANLAGTGPVEGGNSEAVAGTTADSAPSSGALDQAVVYASFAEAFAVLVVALLLLKAAFDRAGRARSLTFVVGGSLVLAAIHSVIAGALLPGAAENSFAGLPLVVEAAAWAYLLPVLVVGLDVLPKQARPRATGVLVCGMLVSLVFLVGGFVGLGVAVAFAGGATAKLAVVALLGWSLFRAPAAPRQEAHEAEAHHTSSGLSRSLVAEASAKGSEPPFDPFAEPGAPPRAAPAASPPKPATRAPRRREPVPEPVAAGRKEQQAPARPEGQASHPPVNPNIKVKAPPKPRKRF